MEWTLSFKTATRIEGLLRRMVERLEADQARIKVTVIHGCERLTASNFDYDAVVRCSDVDDIASGGRNQLETGRSTTDREDFRGSGLAEVIAMRARMPAH
jgi:hypothetical protein